MRNDPADNRITLLFSHAGPMIQYADETLFIDDLNPEHHLTWAMTLAELREFGLNCLAAASAAPEAPREPSEGEWVGPKEYWEAPIAAAPAPREPSEEAVEAAEDANAKVVLKVAPHLLNDETFTEGMRVALRVAYAVDCKADLLTIEPSDDND